MIQHNQLINFFKGKKILITGNTGFKGYWLSFFLIQLDAKVYGLSLNDNKSRDLNNVKITKQYYADIRNYDKIKQIFEEIKPDIVYHLAANAITLNSYENPLETFQTNTMGTVNVLEVLRSTSTSCSAIFITSDKCYENREWDWGYRENDRLGGKDPYSASKSMCEIAVRSYYESFYSKNNKIKIVTCRAGNVIGGGDWGDKRLIPDAIRKWEKKEALVVRNPNSIRPWNYILDLINGYLRVAYALEKLDINGQSFNFGPNQEAFLTVIDLINTLWKYWPNQKFTPIKIVNSNSNKFEHKLLKLYSDKSYDIFGWKPKVSIDHALLETSKWYYNCIKNPTSAMDYSEKVVADYINTFLKK